MTLILVFHTAVQRRCTVGDPAAALFLRLCAHWLDFNLTYMYVHIQAGDVRLAISTHDVGEFVRAW